MATGLRVTISVSSSHFTWQNPPAFVCLLRTAYNFSEVLTRFCSFCASDLTISAWQKAECAIDPCRAKEQTGFERIPWLSSVQFGTQSDFSGACWRVWTFVCHDITETQWKHGQYSTVKWQRCWWDRRKRCGNLWKFIIRFVINCQLLVWIVLKIRKVLDVMSSTVLDKWPAFSWVNHSLKLLSDLQKTSAWTHFGLKLQSDSHKTSAWTQLS